MTRKKIRMNFDSARETETPEKPAAEFELPVEGFTGTPEEKDRQWFERCYRGDTQRQLTVRAVVMGGILGMFMAVSNLYTTLKIGWSFGVSITACVISFVVWNAICSLLGGRVSRMSVLENNCMQSTATAAGSSTGATLATALGALLLITGAHQPWLVAAAFALLTAALGVFLAIPMKRQMINHEQLRFPSGIATAETLRSLYSKSGESLKQAWSLLIALGAGALVGLLHTYAELVEQLKLKNRLPHWLEKMSGWIYLPDTWNFTGFLNPLARGQMAGLAFEPSVLLVGAGMITGLRVSLSMFAGSALLYYIVAPHLVALDAANAGVAGWLPSFKMSPEGDFNPTRWALWGGTAVMVFSSLAQVALNWRTVFRAFTIFKKEERDAAHDAADGRRRGAELLAVHRTHPDHHRPRHRAIFCVPHRRVAGADVRGVFICRVARVLPRDGRNGHHADRRDGQGHATALRRAARRQRHRRHQPHGRRHHGGGGGRGGGFADRPEKRLPARREPAQASFSRNFMAFSLASSPWCLRGI